MPSTPPPRLLATESIDSPPPHDAINSNDNDDEVITLLVDQAVSNPDSAVHQVDDTVLPAYIDDELGFMEDMVDIEPSPVTWGKLASEGTCDNEVLSDDDMHRLLSQVDLGLQDDV